MNQKEDRKITKITDEITENRFESKGISHEQLQREFYYIQAEKMLKRMLEKGLISEGEFNKISALNRQTFFPVLAKIMP